MSTHTSEKLLNFELTTFDNDDLIGLSNRRHLQTTMAMRALQKLFDHLYPPTSPTEIIEDREELNNIFNQIPLVEAEIIRRANQTGFLRGIPRIQSWLYEQVFELVHRNSKLLPALKEVIDSIKVGEDNNSFAIDYKRLNEVKNRLSKYGFIATSYRRRAN